MPELALTVFVYELFSAVQGSLRPYLFVVNDLKALRRRVKPIHKIRRDRVSVLVPVDDDGHGDAIVIIVEHIPDKTLCVRVLDTVPDFAVCFEIINTANGVGLYRCSCMICR